MPSTLSPPSRFSWERIDPDVCARLAARVTRQRGGTPAESLQAEWAEPSDDFLRGYGGNYEALDILLQDWLGLDDLTVHRVYLAARAQGFIERPPRSSLQTSTRLRRLRALSWRRQPTLRRILLDALTKAGSGGLALEDLDTDPLGSSIIVDTRTGASPDPFPHQQTAIRALKKRFARDGLKSRGLLVMPTGSGKTITAVRWLVDDVLANGHKVLWVTHREELLWQSAKAFIRTAPRLAAAGIDRLALQLVGGQFKSSTLIAADEHDVLLATVQSLARRQEELRRWLKRNKVVVIFDEAHHSPAPSWRRIFTLATTETNDAVIGLTATPTRTRKSEVAELIELFGGRGAVPRDAIIHEVGIDELLRAEVLARPSVLQEPTHIDITEDLTAEDRRLLKIMADLPPRMRRRLRENATRNQLIVDTYLENPAAFAKTLVFALDTEHCDALASMFSERGVAVDRLHFGRRPDENRAALRAFRTGEVQILVNVEMLTEGIDVADAKTVFLTRPTRSLALFSQMVGRALRGPKVGGTTDAYVVDFQDLWTQFPEWRASWAGMDIPEAVGESPPTAAPAAPAATEPTPPVDEQLIALMEETLRRVQSVTVQSGVDAVPSGYLAYQQDSEDGTIDRALLVFEHQEPGFDRLRDALENGDLASLRRSGDWRTDYFDDLPAPAPPQSALDDLRSWVLEAQKFPVFHRFETVDVLRPERVADDLHNAGVSDLHAVEQRASELFEEHRALGESIWGDRAAYTRQVADELVRLHIGQPKEVESIRVPRIIGHRLEDWEYGSGIFDLPAIVTRLLGDTSLFPTELRPPVGAIRWTKDGAVTWGFYRDDDESLVINRLLDSPTTPPFVLEFVVFHELLHHEQKVEERFPGREPRYLLHGPDFSRRERMFPEWNEARVFLGTFSRRFLTEHARK